MQKKRFILVIKRSNFAKEPSEKRESEDNLGTAVKGLITDYVDKA